MIGGLLDYGLQVYQNYQGGYRGWGTFTHVCIDELLIAMASGAVMGGTAFVLAPLLAPVAELGWAGSFFAGATEGALVNSTGTIASNTLSGRAWNTGLREAYTSGYLGGGVLGLAGRAIKGWAQAGQLGDASRILRSASEGQELPPTGISTFDDLVEGTSRYARWKANLQGRGFEVVEESLGKGIATEILDGKVTIDLDRFRYIDLLHESRHIRQLEGLQAKNLAMSPRIVSWFERGAYEYERRLGQRFGFSEEYMQFIDTRIGDYWSRSLRQKYIKSGTTRDFLNGIWK